MGRLRKKPWADEYLLLSIVTSTNPKEYKGKWNTFFGNEKPLWIEIGMGKGSFTLEQSKNNEDINILGIEKFSSVQVVPVRKVEESKISNLKFISGDASEILEWFDEETIDRIFINFPDPWPKERHSKRRLVFRTFLNDYYKILKKGSFIEFKTDQEDLFNFLLDEISNTKFIASDVERDLHKISPNVIKTEYEKKFSERGNKIHFVRLTKQ